MFTRTITLAGAELSSFLAAGGQTVNPDAPSTSPAAAATTPTVTQVPFPIATPTTAAAATTTAAAGNVATAARPALAQTSSSAAAAVVTTSSTSAAAVVASSSSSTTSSLVTSTSRTVAPTSSTIATSTRALASTTTSPAASTLKPATSSVRAASSAARSGVNAALTASKSKATDGSSGLSGGGIAGLIIGLLLLFGIIAGFLILWRKRKSDKAARDSRSNSRNEKGMIKLEEEEVSSPGENKGFDFGNLPAIAPVATFNNSNNARDANFRSASPADMQRGAAVLGIQRPFTPPPGHPAHPAYQQPPALAANRQMQRPQGYPNPGPQQRGPQMQKPVGMLPSQMQQQQGRNLTPNGGQMPRKPIPAGNAPAPQRRLSSNNPFNDPANETRDVAPPLPKPTSPIVKIVGSPSTMQTVETPAAAAQATHAAAPVPAPVPVEERRASLDSFVAGDDSLDGDNLSDAVSPRTKSTEVMPLAVTEPTTAAQEDRPLSPNSEEPGPSRSKSVLVATDQWAARKAHLKNTLALSPRMGSPAPEQSPFADPMPLLDDQLGSFSPMDLNFDQHVAKDE